MPLIGTVRFTVRPGSRHISVRWREGVVVCNVPPGVSLSHAREVIGSMTGRILESRPSLTYSAGQRMDFDGWSVRLIDASAGQNLLEARLGDLSAELHVPGGFDFGSEMSTRRISGLLCRVARKLAPGVIIPHARELAERVGRRPAMWDISGGHRTLGTCDSRGVIHLSYMNMFLPRHLREYIICHELAHLSEMNHSPRFHSLCDSYCGGREKDLIRELKQYRWPVLK